MGAKVKRERNAWWVFTHHQGRRWKRRVGASKAHKREADEIAKKINASIALGTFAPQQDRPVEIPCATELRRWYKAYSPTMKVSYEQLVRGHVENHLAPYFGSKDLRTLREMDLLGFVRAKLDQGLHPKTIRNSLSVLRRVLTLLHREGRVERNVASRIGELMSRIDRSSAVEVKVTDAWTIEEVDALLELARTHEPQLHPALAFLFYTGTRRGEVLGLKWEDVDFDRARIHIRRAVVRSEVTTPKSGPSRYVAMAPELGSLLLDVLADRRRSTLAGRWPDIPPWVFPSESGTPIDQDNFERTWRRIQRRAHAAGVRPLKLHCTRHTWASLALAAGKSVRWVADQLGHADPAMTLRVYAHAMPEAESDLSFLRFSPPLLTRNAGPRRPYTAPLSDHAPEDEDAPSSNYSGRLTNAWRAQHDSNMRPSGPQPDALSN